MTIFSLLQSQPLLLTAVCTVLGLMVGSFLNVVIYRLPKMMERQWHAEYAQLSGAEAPPAARFDLVVPRSQCPACGHKLGVLENIPVASYFFLGGKCSSCKTRISPRYPAVEALSGVVSGYVAWRFGFSLATAGALLFAWAMIALAFIDLDTFYLPDDITLPLLWAGLIFNLGGVYSDLQSAVIGAIAGYLALWSVYWIFKLATGKQGMGYGDFKLLAAIGAWLGWKMLPQIILLSSLLGAVIGLSMIVFARRGRNVPIPFGPYLAVAGLVALLHGDAINRQYLSLF